RLWQAIDVLGGGTQISSESCRDGRRASRGAPMSSAAVGGVDAAPEHRSRVRRAVSHYRRAQQSFRTPASDRSRHGLDWANFFIADVQTGFGTFVAFYLAGLGWAPGSVGLALGASALAAVIGQIPGGALTDALPWKRGL